jgi:hypothetical protein
MHDLIDMRVTVFACCVLLIGSPARAQSVVSFIAGAAAALGMHEAGHVATDLAFDATPGVKKVSFAGIPFFAITHPRLSAKREFVVSSAGFWVQEASNELLLSRRPQLKEEHAPFVKGMFVFNTVTSVAYAGAAFARVGPDERDTRGMAVTARLPEPWVGGVVLAPALLDAARYYKPELRWLRWASRASKAAGVLLLFRGGA